MFLLLTPTLSSLKITNGTGKDDRQWRKKRKLKSSGNGQERPANTKGKVNRNNNQNHTVGDSFKRSSTNSYPAHSPTLHPRLGAAAQLLLEQKKNLLLCFFEEFITAVNEVCTELLLNSALMSWKWNVTAGILFPFPSQPSLHTLRLSKDNALFFYFPPSIARTLWQYSIPLWVFSMLLESPTSEN